MKVASFTIAGTASYGIVTDKGVIDAGKRLKGKIARRFEPVLGKLGAADDVGVHVQPLHHLLSDRRASKSAVMHPDTARSLQAQAVEIVC